MTEPTTSLADATTTAQAPSVYVRARDLAAKAFDAARLAEDEARSAFAAVGRDVPQDVYVEALGKHQRASERVTQCSAALAALEKAALNATAEANR